MDGAGRERADAYGLCFNVDNLTIRRLSQFEGKPRIVDTVLTALYGGALLGAGVMFTPDLNQQLAGAQTSIIDLLLEQVDSSSIATDERDAESDLSRIQPLSEPAESASLDGGDRA